MLKRVMGIEPTYLAWKASVLPLNYTRIKVGVTGFEPATSWSQTRRSSQAEPHPEGIYFSVAFLTTKVIICYSNQYVNTFFYFFLAPSKPLILLGFRGFKTLIFTKKQRNYFSNNIFFTERNALPR